MSASYLSAVCVLLMFCSIGNLSKADTLQVEGTSPIQRIVPKIPVKLGPPAEFDSSLPGKPDPVINGVTATKEQCDSVMDTAWVDTHLQSACIRYYFADFDAIVKSSKRRAVAYFTGDVYDGRRVVPEYSSLTAIRLQEMARDWAESAKLPLVIVGRPGILGSSGDHMERRRQAESLLVSAALDVLGRRLGVKEWILVGYSGGGHVVTSLLTYRSDVVCAVPTASVASPRMRAELRNWAVYATGYADSFEPLENLSGHAMHPDLRVIIVGDPLDKNGVWPAQTILASKLNEIRVPVDIVKVKGTGAQRHGGQGGIGRRVAAWCGHDLSFEEIQKKVSEM